MRVLDGKLSDALQGGCRVVKSIVFDEAAIEVIKHFGCVLSDDFCDLEEGGDGLGR